VTNYGGVPLSFEAGKKSATVVELFRAALLSGDKKIVSGSRSRAGGRGRVWGRGRGRFVTHSGQKSGRGVLIQGGTLRLEMEKGRMQKEKKLKTSSVKNDREEVCFGV